MDTKRHRPRVYKNVPHALIGTSLPGLAVVSGKTADNYTLPSNQRLIVRTDRLTAFDQPLAVIPYKGQVLTQIAAWWFAQLADIIPNHLIKVVDPNVLLTHEVTPLPVEVIMRGYITGVTGTSIWTMYNRGERKMYGQEFPDGMVKNQKLPRNIVTPTTKEKIPGRHDAPLSPDEVVALGLVPGAIWEMMEYTAQTIFALGQKIAQRSGLILVDTKYEFGLDPDGKLVLIDEAHTPDSSRYWRESSYEERLAAGQEPEILDKEYVRLWYKAQGYSGNGPAPQFPVEEVVNTSLLYIELYERLTQTGFIPATYPAEARIIRSLRREGILS